MSLSSSEGCFHPCGTCRKNTEGGGEWVEGKKKPFAARAASMAPAYFGLTRRGHAAGTSLFRRLAQSSSSSSSRIHAHRKRPSRRAAPRCKSRLSRLAARAANGSIFENKKRREAKLTSLNKSFQTRLARIVPFFLRRLFSPLRYVPQKYRRGGGVGGR